MAKKCKLKLICIILEQIQQISDVMNYNDVFLVLRAVVSKQPKVIQQGVGSEIFSTTPDWNADNEFNIRTIAVFRVRRITGILSRMCHCSITFKAFDNLFFCSITLASF